MILRYAHLSRHPEVFHAMTGLTVAAFDDLVADLLPACVTAKQQRLTRLNRRRAIGGGRHDDLCWTNQIVLTVIWLRTSPTNQVLAYLIGVSDSTVSRLLARMLPLLEAAGKDTMRLPDPGRKRRRQLDDLLRDTPALAVVLDTFEQRIPRCKDRDAADAYSSGQKKQHTLKSQVAVDEETGQIVDGADSVPGPTADITVLEQSGLLARLPDGVGGIGDLAYVGIGKLHPKGLGASPRRKPRGKERPPADIAYNRACARRRIGVEHTIGRMRRYQALNQADRQHRQHHSARVRAVAGLVNRQRPPFASC
jgi:hypothetical protein